MSDNVFSAVPHAPSPARPISAPATADCDDCGATLAAVVATGGTISSIRGTIREVTDAR